MLRLSPRGPPLPRRPKPPAASAPSATTAAGDVFTHRTAFCATATKRPLAVGSSRVGIYGARQMGLAPAQRPIKRPWGETSPEAEKVVSRQPALETYRPQKMGGGSHGSGECAQPAAAAPLLPSAWDVPFRLILVFPAPLDAWVARPSDGTAGGTGGGEAGPNAPPSREAPRCRSFPRNRVGPGLDRKTDADPFPWPASASTGGGGTRSVPACRGRSPFGPSVVRQPTRAAGSPRPGRWRGRGERRPRTAACPCRHTPLRRRLRWGRRTRSRP